MMWIVLCVVIGFIGVAAYAKWRQAKYWETILEEREPYTDDAIAKYEFLKSRRIRCKMKTVDAAQNFGMTNDAARQMRVRVEVYKDDVAQAKQLLQEFTPKKPRLKL